MPRGGRRKGAGRKVGVPNKVTADLRQRILASGESPLEFLVRLQREPMPEREEGESLLVYVKRLELWDRNRIIGAKEAAPYLHSRLSAIEVSGKDGEAIQHQHKVEIEFVTPEPRKK